MAKPVANFSILANGLSVAFTDRSSNVPTSWAWNFGDNQTSTSQNPNHAYALPGEYLVTLVATNTDGNNTMSVELLFNSAPTISATIREMVQYNLPVGITFDSMGFLQQVQTWQLFLQGAAKVPDFDVFNEAKWPSLYNVLISRLVIKDLIIKAADTASVGLYVAAAELASQTGTIASGIGKGPLKALEAGPSKAQWHDPSMFWSSIFKTAANGKGGIMSGVQDEICYYANKLTVKITGCIQGDTLGGGFIITNQRRGVVSNSTNMAPLELKSGNFTPPPNPSDPTTDCPVPNTDGRQIQVFSNDSNKFLEQGTEWIKISTGFRIIIPYFDAKASNYTFYIFIQ